MDTIEEVVQSVNLSTEEILPTDATFNTNSEDIILEDNVNIEAQIKDTTAISVQSVDVIPEKLDDVKNTQQNEENRNKSDLLSADIKLHCPDEASATVTDVEKLYLPVNPTENADDIGTDDIVNEQESINEENEGQISNDAHTIRSTETESNVKHNQAFDKHDSTLIEIHNSKNTEDINLEAILESSIKDMEPKKPISHENELQDNTENVKDADLPCNTDKDEVIQIPETNQTIIHPEIILEGVELIQEDTVGNTEISKTQENYDEEIQTVNLENENVNAVSEHEFSTTTEISEINSPDANNCVEDVVTQEETYDHSELNLVTEDVSNDEEITHLVGNNNMEKQISDIIREESQSCPKASGKISIAEAISRDFDETDTEEVDIRKENDEELKTVEVSHDDLVVDVSLSDQLEQGAVTVTDTSGQIYYVQSVEDLIVVENEDMASSIDQPDTIEVTVVSEMDQTSQEGTKPAKGKEKPAIPSHILGRHINNPVIDTFRNGKVPPKPRLGVKIPYKNLTSQIVSKDEIAKEILDRRNQKYKRSGQTTREMLFAQKITQRLVKKIAPSDNSSTPVKKNKHEEAIDNSDLLAILEGDIEECEFGSDNKLASTSKPTDGKVESKVSQNIKQTSSAKGETKKPMSKSIEREIALKQLQELPPGPKRRRYASLSNKRYVDDSAAILIENDVLSGNSAAIGETSVAKTTEVDNTPIKGVDTSSSTKNSNAVPKVQVEQDKNTLNETLQRLSTTVTKSEATNVSKANVSEPKSLPTKEVATIEAIESELKDVKQSHSTNKIETSDKTKQLSSAKASVVPVKVKTDAAKHPLSNTADNKTKIDAPIKSISAKIDSSKVTDPLAINTKEEFAERKQTGNPPIKTYTRKRKSIEDASVVSNVPDKKSTLTHKDTNIPPNTYITKSSRIIKKKVIWDPDEPSTARSLMSKSPKPNLMKSEKPIKMEMNPSKTERKSLSKPAGKVETKSPTRSPDSHKSKKRLSEVDKLLMDEGAINMLYAFKNVDETSKKKKAAVISLDKVQRELINKSNEIKKDLKTNSDKVSPKSLRRKDSPIPTVSKKIVPASISRKKSKDSNRSSLHSPPASPSLIYPNNAEASRIIRRHSSSSYSSMEGDFDSEKRIDIENQEVISVDPEKINKKRMASIGENNKSKRIKKNTDKENIATSAEVSSNDDSFNNSNKVAVIEENKLKYDKYKTISVKEFGHMVQIILLPSFNNEAYLTPEVIEQFSHLI